MVREDRYANPALRDHEINEAKVVLTNATIG